MISLDPVSLPPGYALTDGGRESGKGWTRLLRTPVGGGALLRQNFVLTAKGQDRVNHQIRSAGCLAVTNTSRHRNARSRVQAGNQTHARRRNHLTRMVNVLYEMAASDNVEPGGARRGPDHFACAEFGIDVARSGDRSTHGAELERQSWK